MKKYKFYIPAVIFLAILSYFTSSVLASTYHIVDGGYNSPRITVHPHLSNTWYTNRLVAAANSWNATPTRALIVIGTAVSSSSPDYNATGANIIEDIEMQELPDQYGEYDIIGSQGVIYTGSTYIYATDNFYIWINSAAINESTNVNDQHIAQFTFAHELGHALSLGDHSHIASYRKSIMNSYTTKSTYYVPSSEDIAGVNYVWP